MSSLYTQWCRGGRSLQVLYPLTNLQNLWSILLFLMWVFPSWSKGLQTVWTLHLILQSCRLINEPVLFAFTDWLCECCSIFLPWQALQCVFPDSLRQSKRASAYSDCSPVYSSFLVMKFESLYCRTFACIYYTLSPGSGTSFFTVTALHALCLTIVFLFKQPVSWLTQQPVVLVGLNFMFLKWVAG